MGTTFDLQVHLFYLQVAVLEVAQPESLLAVVERQHGFDPVHKLLQAFLQRWNVVGQARVLSDLSVKHNKPVCEPD